MTSPNWNLPTFKHASRSLRIAKGTSESCTRYELLLDENLSRRIVPFLQNAYPGSTQVVLAGMERASDAAVWEYAKTNSFVIVTKDSDYYDMSLLHGAPPHVIWAKAGNVSKAKITDLLISHRETIEKMLHDDGMACVEIY